MEIDCQFGYNFVITILWFKFFYNLAVLGDSTTFEDDKTPILIVIPGLTSDSSAAVSSNYCLQSCQAMSILMIMPWSVHCCAHVTFNEIPYYP